MDGKRKSNNESERKRVLLERVAALRVEMAVPTPLRPNPADTLKLHLSRGSNILKHPKKNRLNSDGPAEMGSILRGARLSE